MTMNKGSEYRNLSFSIDDGIATVTVDRVESLNALTTETLEELSAVIERARADAEVRALIVTGAGQRAFVAGADIKELAEETSTTGHLAAERGQRVLRSLETIGKPVVAAINGYALGGGLELALACHLRIASDNAKLGLPEVGLGVIPGYGGTQRLARLVGRGRALELILTGGHIDAEEAHRIGLVNRVVPQRALAEEARAWVRKIIANGPVALKHALAAVDGGLDTSLEKGMLIEAQLFGILFGTSDQREGMDAFLSKRKANFTGE